MSGQYICYFALEPSQFEGTYLRMPRPASARKASITLDEAVKKDFSTSCEETFSSCLEACCTAQWKSTAGFQLPESLPVNVATVPDPRPLDKVCELLVATVEEQGGGRYIPPWWLTGSLWGPDDTAGLSSPAELASLTREMHRSKFLEIILGTGMYTATSGEMISLVRFLEQQAKKDMWLLGTRRDESL